MNSNKSAKSVYDLETKLSGLLLERQNQFNHLHNLEYEINDKEEILTQKDVQISLLKDQLKFLVKEIETIKKESNNQSYMKLQTNNVIKTIRGGGNWNKATISQNHPNYMVPNQPSLFSA